MNKLMVCVAAIGRVKKNGGGGGGWEVWKQFMHGHKNPEIDIEGEDFNRPDHFELLHNLGCHYDSIISEINTRSVIEEAHIDCTH